MAYQYHLIRSRRKTISLGITRTGGLEVRCPVGMTDDQVRAFVESKASWIEKHLPKTPPLPPFTPEQIREMARKALDIFPKRAAFFAQWDFSEDIFENMTSFETAYANYNIVYENVSIYFDSLSYKIIKSDDNITMTQMTESG